MRKMAAALKTAGIAAPAEALEARARLILAETGMDYEAARDALWLAMLREPLLAMAALGIHDDPRRRLLDAVLSPVAEEMRAGRGAMEDQTPSSSLPPSPATDAGRNGQQTGDAHHEYAADRLAGTGGQGESVTHQKSASPPAPQDHVHASAVVAQSVLDTFRITERQGGKMAIGDLPVSAYARYIRSFGKRAWAFSREYTLVKLLAVEAGKNAHIPEGALTRHIFSAEEMIGLIRTATELAQPIITGRAVHEAEQTDA